MDMLKGSLLDSSVYLGVSILRYREKIFKWLLKIDGHSGYTNFQAGEPEDSGSESCVVADAARNFEWKDVRCSDMYPVLCKTPATVVQEATPPAPATTPSSTLPASSAPPTAPPPSPTPSPVLTSCKESEHLFNGSCFWFYPLSMYSSTHNWTEAQGVCRMKDMNLASVHSEEENQFIHGILEGYRGRSLWIGFTDVDKEGVFTWMDKTPVDYTNWREDEPERDNRADNQDCTNFDSYTGKWFDYDCSKEGFRVVCRRDA